jgi:hypothetical protein
LAMFNRGERKDRRENVAALCVLGGLRGFFL